MSRKLNVRYPIIHNEMISNLLHERCSVDYSVSDKQQCDGLRAGCTNAAKLNRLLKLT